MRSAAEAADGEGAPGGWPSRAGSTAARASRCGCGDGAQVERDGHRLGCGLTKRAVAEDSVHIAKQENVPALLDNNSRIAVDIENFKIITKPHGHGDIHNLLYDSGLA